ncbi:unnamed protein product [Bursaphelenchus xylophilus]|uniref:(pine wood nematode) hypothetical protein n=1 Tax=Bursaphelenchus xylophilus TaxID=6326 RepID=A0A1I7S4S3_BURXY|nr:unnamed protein product [Bursaphelenchus xylophilus]CAG9117338.1 unnamed protein product [Bursaphelenchus xylophilus]
MKEPCKICGTETKSICYKLYVCGACTMFYRRNFRFWGKLSCRMNGNCNLLAGASNDRRTCRACRLKACRDLGLRMIGKSLVVQQDGLPENDILEPDEAKSCSCTSSSCCATKQPIVKREDADSWPSSSEASPGDIMEVNPTAASPVSPSTSQNSHSMASTQLARDIAITMNEYPNYIPSESGFRPYTQYQYDVVSGFHEMDRYPHLTHLKRIVEVFRRFRERQRNISIEVMNVDVDLEPEPPLVPPIQIGSLQFPVMERKMVQLACIAIIEFLEGCEGLTIDEKVQIMKPTMNDISLLFKMYLTCRRYPQKGDSRMGMWTGVYNDVDAYDTYMSDLLPVLGPDAYLKHYNKSRTLVVPFYERMKRVMDRFRDFMPCAVEFSVLACMMVYERMETVEIQTVLAMRLRDKLCAELSVYLSDRYPPHVVSVRMMRMSTLLYAVRECDNQYADMFSLLGVLIPENRDQDFQTMPDVVPEMMRRLVLEHCTHLKHLKPKEDMA